MARAHVGALGQRLHREVPGEVLDDVAAHLAQRLAHRLLRGECGAELRLVAGTAQEQHQMASDRQRGVAVEVFLDQRQREVHAGGDAGGGPDVAVAQEDRLGVDPHRGVQAGELGGRRPVSGGAAAVEQAGAASRKAPVQTEAVRRARLEAAAIQSSVAASALAALEP